VCSLATEAGACNAQPDRTGIQNWYALVSGAHATSICKLRQSKIKQAQQRIEEEVVRLHPWTLILFSPGFSPVMDADRIVETVSNGLCFSLCSGAFQETVKTVDENVVLGHRAEAR
jgi:hypothetical protein